MEGMERDKAMLLAEASITAAGSADHYVVPHLVGSVLYVFRSMSVSFPGEGKRDAMEQNEFNRLSNAVEDVIKGFDLDPDQLLEERKRRVK